MPAIITAKEQNLVKVFSDDYFFDIPLYQRPYAWTTEEVDALLDDLEDAMNRDMESPYFLGNVVLIKSDSSAISEVVDGQQRLTTLTMLLCVLRDILASSNSETADELDTFVREIGMKLKGTQDRFRLSLRQKDREFFQQHVQNRGGIADFLRADSKRFSDSQKRMHENAKCLHEKLLKLDENQRENLAQYVIDKCYLVIVSASDGDSAYRIFSVMNSRGMPLSPTDILKANVIGKVPEDSQEEYATKWENREVELGRDDFRDLFAHIRTIHRKEKLRDTFQKEFQEYVVGDLTPQRAAEFVDDILDPYADVYEIVSRASYESTEGAEKVNSLLRHLGRLDNFDWIPPAIAYFLREQGQQDNLIKFTRDLERIAYGLFIIRANLNDRISRYAQVLRAIERDEDLFEEGAPLQLQRGEKANILRVLDGDIYGLPRVPMPLLLRLDSLLSEAGVSHHHRVISIEHVLPLEILRTH